MDNYNYPMGADTPNAPWNEKDIPDKKMECEVYVTLFKNVDVMTNLYNEDEDGYEFIGSYNDVEQAYREQHNNIPMLLGELSKYINGELAGGNISASRKVELEEMLESCKGWEISEVEITDYKLS